MTGNQPLAAYPRLAAADMALKAGELDKANALALQHLREHRDEPRGLALLGSIALKGGALVQAEQFLRHAMARGATSFDVQWELASAINQQERLGEALQAFAFSPTQPGAAAARHQGPYSRQARAQRRGDCGASRANRTSSEAGSCLDRLRTQLALSWSNG